MLLFQFKSHLTDEVHAARIADKVEHCGVLLLLVPLQLVLRHRVEVALAAPHLVLEVDSPPERELLFF